MSQIMRNTWRKIRCCVHVRPKFLIHPPLLAEESQYSIFCIASQTTLSRENEPIGTLIATQIYGIVPTVSNDPHKIPRVKSKEVPAFFTENINFVVKFYINDALPFLVLSLVVNHPRRLFSGVELVVESGSSFL